MPFLTVAEAGALIKSRRLSPVELTRSLLARIERLNPLLNAYITVSGDLAMEQARRAESEIARGNYRGPLHGIPVSLKDLIATAGVLTTGGTGALADWVPSEDAVAWQRLMAAGAILLGKTNLDEIASGFATVNPFFGPTRNPWDTSRIAGGSSGGSAVAVAANMCLASIGSDTNGSIRVPGALCGVAGLKPTFGRVSTRGALYLSWTSDHLGPLTKTVEDAALVLNAIAGHEPGDPLSADVPAEDFTLGLGQDLRGTRIAVPANYFWDFSLPVGDGSSRPGLDGGVAKAVRTAIDLLRERGAQVEEIVIAALDNAERDLINTVEMAVERAVFFEHFPAERWELFSQRYRDGARRGFELTAAEYFGAIRRAQSIQAAIQRALTDHDALIVPTTPFTAPTIEAVQAASGFPSQPGSRPGAGPTAGIGRYTAPFNRSGHPALTIPCGFDSAGLPIGMMVVANHFDELATVRVANAYQRETEWYERRPHLT